MPEPMTLQALQARAPGASPVAVGVTVGALGLGLSLPGRRVRFAVEGWERVPRDPAVIVANHTHWMDWVALRWVAWKRGRHLCNWVKPRTYEEGWARFLDLTGNVPVVSRGYLLAADVRALHGRPPGEREYRALRDHLDTSAPLPDGAFFDAVQHTPRRILGVDFAPEAETWRACVDRLFHAMMSATLDHTRTLCDRGVHLQIMPQGVTSMRLTKGHPGALQAALALDLRIVPVGINGFPQAWGDKVLLPRRGGEVRIRFGEPFRPDPIPGHTPFLPDSERAHADDLEAGTRAMMDRIAELLEPEHAPGDEEAEGDVRGVARFV